MPETRDRKRELIRSAAHLSRSAPEPWRAFLATFDEHQALRYEELVSAHPDNVLVAQGRAQEARDLNKLLHDAPIVDNKLEEQRRR